MGQGKIILGQDKTLSGEKMMISRDAILLVDPFRNLLNAYRMVLEEESYLVETARNIEEVLDLFSKRPYSVVITEYFLPSEETYRLIQRLKEKSPETYIIMITNTLLEDKDYERLFGGWLLDDIILKPYSPAKILVHVRKGISLRNLLLERRSKERRSKERRAQERRAKERPPVLGRADLPAEQLDPDAFKRSLRQELKRSKRHKHPMSLLIVELPAREEIGEIFEDFRLELARLLERYTREEDIVGRENGSLGILLPETNQFGSEVLTRRLSQLVRGHPNFLSDKALRAFVDTLSIQSFTFPDAFSVPESLRTVLDEVNREHPSG